MNDIIRAALTPKQAELGDLVLEGLTNKEIAERLGVSLDGVKRRVHTLCVLLRAGTGNFDGTDRDGNREAERAEHRR